ncbi:hypothetical protein BsWGS_28292 [Bradybaena similaris]
MYIRSRLEYLVQICLALVCVLEKSTAPQDCDKKFTYSLDEPEGEFQSPSFPSHYPNGVSCKYKFIGRPSQRVKIQFHQFSVQGRPPGCTSDFVNIYSQVKHENDDLLEAVMTGPFCGESKDDLPKMVVSTYNVLVIWFYSNHEKSSSGFHGTWEFIDAVTSLSVPYDMGTMSPNNCGYTIRSDHKDQGFILSPTYPGIYTDNLYCYYKLHGKPGQRIKLVFEDFSLFYGGEYCPFDYLRIYDGFTKNKPVIGTFCGSYNQSTIIYSTGEALWLDFVTGEGRPIFEASNGAKFARRGFNISYIFSDHFVKLDDHFIKEGAEHVKGTECDQRILSSKESNGTFVSPGYPANFKEGIVCRYYMDGLMDEQNLERVKVSFYDFNIPGNMPYCLLGYVGEHEDGRLSEGSVKNKYCGSNDPPSISSEGPRMVITLNTSGAVQGGKFVARYAFITDYDIKGEQIEEGKCRFQYNNAKTSQGTVNSPRHPNGYPVNLDCEYVFRPLLDHLISISFHSFTLSDAPSKICDTGDYLAFYEDVGTFIKENFTLTEKYCSTTVPGPYMSSRILKLVFHSDDRLSYMGFKASYRFIRKQDIDNTCSSYLIDARGSGGIIMSPSYPTKYPALTRCEWIVQASNSDNRILLEVSDLSLEGTFGGAGGPSSCSDVAVRLFEDRASIRPVEVLCGKKKDDDVTESYLSIADTFKILFLSSPSSLGAKGFKLSWTEVYRGPAPSGHSDVECAGFRCVVNKYCISSTLKCNNEPNCGKGDDSDETVECSRPSGIQILHIAIGTSISSFFCIILLICGFYHRRKFRSDRAPPDHDHVEVRYVSAPTGCNTTDRLLMEDRNEFNNDHHKATTQSPRCQKVSMV